MWKRREKEYANIRGFGLTLFSKASLWMGVDHLLLLERYGYAEACKRFYYEDIQAIIIQLNRHRLYWGLGLAAPLCLCALWMLSASGETLWPAGIITGFWLLLFLGNYLRGPACSCRIQTRTNEQSIASLRRLRAARKAVAKLTPLIEAAQGPLDRAALLAYAPPPPIEERAPARLNPLSGAQEPSITRFHWLCAALFLLDTLLIVLLALFPSLGMIVASDGLLLVIFLLSMVAVAVQNRGQMSPSLRGWGWTAFGFAIAKGALMIPASFFMGFDLVGEIPESSVWRMVVMALLLALGALTCALAAAGLFLLNKNQRLPAAAEPPPLRAAGPPPLPGELG